MCVSWHQLIKGRPFGGPFQNRPRLSLSLLLNSLNFVHFIVCERKMEMSFDVADKACVSFKVMDITEKDRIDEQGNKVKSVLTDEQACIIYSICHVTSMLSACANPVIYGYLNENFNKEFRDILSGIQSRLSCCCKSSSATGGAKNTDIIELNASNMFCRWRCHHHSCDTKAELETTKMQRGGDESGTKRP